MAFLDFFKPKHLHSDPEVRIASIGGLNAKRLVRVARRDLNPKVRLATQAYLDVAELLQIACHDANHEVHMAAGARLENAEQRAKWVSVQFDPAVLDAVGKLPESELIDVILAKPRKARALALLQRVSGDQNLLRIVNSDASKSVREQAARQLSDPELIYDRLSADMSKSERQVLIEKLSHSLLEEKLVSDVNVHEQVRKTLERREKLRSFMVTEATITATCPNCEQPLFVRSVSLEHACEHCEHVSVWKPDFWKVDILEKPLRNGNHQTVIASGAHGPRNYQHGHTAKLLACDGCGAPVGETCEEACRACGLSLGLQPVPAWLAKLKRGGRRVLYVGIPTESSTSGDDRPVPTKSAVRVVWGPGKHA